MYRLPFSLIPQVAFVGRSNVGKSSLINAILHGREVARPSPMAGRTRQLFTFDVADKVSLVDLPGYGFSGKVASNERESWLAMIREYISRANALELIVALIDARQGMKSLDEQFLQSLSALPMHPKRTQRPHVLVCLTKTDLIDPHVVDQTSRATLAAVDNLRRSHKLQVWPYLHAVSAETGFGLKELRATITSMCPME
jgi:GTP-binding protein